MSQNESFILSVIHRKLAVSQVAKQYEVTRAWVYKLLARYREEGRAAFVPASRRPHSNPRATSNHMSQRICQIRMELLREGLDAGPQSISYRLKAEKLSPPSIATIWRVLSRQGLVTPEPKKSPKPTCSAYIRIAADTVVERFADLVNEFGVPRSTLTDNDLVFTTRLVKGRNAFKYLLDSLGIEQKNSRPHHPQTQGKVERFH